LFAEREEKVGARVRVDDRLKRRFRLVHLQRRTRRDRVPPHGAQKVADHRDIRIEHLRSRRRTAVHRQGASWSTSAFRSRRHLRCWFRRGSGRRRCCSRLRSGRRRRLRGGRRALCCRQLAFERRQAIAVLLLQRFEVLAQLIDFLPQRLRRILS
jgi:hypothetical protein